MAGFLKQLTAFVLGGFWNNSVCNFLKKKLSADDVIATLVTTLEATQITSNWCETLATLVSFQILYNKLQDF